MKVSVLTFGCRVNLADSIALERGLRAAGAEIAPVETADVVVVNTCAVTAAAEQDARQAVRRVARARPVKVVVTGCYATRRPQEVAGLAGVVGVVPNDRKEGLVSSLRPGLRSSSACPAGVLAAPRPGALGRTVHTLRVQNGCDEACSYCIVPATRGPGRSMPPSRVLDELDAAVAAGFREVTITGVHLGSYGRDLTPPTSLGALLARLAARVPAGLLLRVGSIEPMDLAGDVEAALCGGPPFAPHIHLPLQHASNRILAAMRRPYTIECYSHLVEGLRRVRPDAAIGADVLVGFPGEREDDHEALAGYLRGSPLSYLHVFSYSLRPGTAAAALPGRVAGAVARRRQRHIRTIGAGLADRFRASQVGLVRDGLTTEDGTVVVTDNHLKVRVRPGLARNERVRVRITGEGTPMAGEIVGS